MLLFHINDPLRKNFSGDNCAGEISAAPTLSIYPASSHAPEPIPPDQASGTLYETVSDDLLRRLCAHWKSMSDKDITRSSAAEYLTFVAATGDQSEAIEVRYQDENVWLTQKMMAALYDVEVNTVNYHLKKIFANQELTEDSVIRNYRITAADGKSYSTNHSSL